VGNLAAIPYAAAGFLTAYPTGTNPPTSTLNFNAGQVRANNFQLGLSGNGQLTIAATTSVDAIVDLVGYFAHDPPTWTVTMRDEANRLATEYTVPPAGGGSISRVKNYLYLGNLLAATRNAAGGYTYYASDHLGTPRVSTGAEPTTRKYQPFGLEIPGPSGGLPIKFAAMERDLTSGNDFDHARYQSSLLGRFLSPDKVTGFPGDPQSWNRYSYVRNNPLTRVDPDGQVDQNFAPVLFPTNPAAQAAFQNQVGGVAVATAALAIPDPTDLVLGFAAARLASGGRIAQFFSRLLGEADEIGDSARFGRGGDILENRVRGDSFRDEVAEGFKNEGRQVRTEVVKHTPFGPRRVDIEVSKDGKVLGGVETKTGGSRYTPDQRSKDEYLRRKNYCVQLVRGPDGGGQGPCK
jgi:RHS repeat-associated protein